MRGPFPLFASRLAARVVVAALSAGAPLIARSAPDDRAAGAIPSDDRAGGERAARDATRRESGAPFRDGVPTGPLAHRDPDAPAAPNSAVVRAAPQGLPVWEAGIGAATFTVPDYRGSDERRDYLLPFPYLIYRGDHLRVDREGIRAKLFDDERLDVQLSLAATYALRADQNRARQDMPALRTMVEIGPEFVFRVLDPRQAPVALDLRLSTRAALEIDRGLHHQGWTASPSVRLVVPDVARTGFDASVSLGALYGSRDYHAYYYGVSPEQAQIDRPAYAASGGFGGWQLILGSSRRMGDWWLGAYVRVDSLSGATFEASPLVRTDRYFTAGIALAYVIGKSSQRVPALR